MGQSSSFPDLPKRNDSLTTCKRDTTSFLCPYGNSAMITHDALSCVDRFVDTPLWVGIGGDPASNGSVQMISCLDFSKNDMNWVDEEEWPFGECLYPFVVPYGYHSALILGGELEGEQYSNEAYLWSHGKRSSTCKIPNMQKKRYRLTANLIGDNIIVIGGEKSSSSRCSIEVSNANGWVLHQLPSSVPSLTYHTSVVMSTTNIVTFGSRDFKDDFIHTIDPVTLSVSSGNCGYSIKPYDVGSRAGVVLGCGNAYVKHGTNARVDLCDMPIIIDSDSALSYETHSMVISECTRSASGAFRSGENCCVYDSRANAWFYESRWISPIECGYIVNVQ